ncbi:hypothetical protein K501DRAFT_288288 [Backusella circina FSU 941]|nr:hypothetical protein K501DRAFT_288288 [Backusella circina FSU 941]
MALENNNETDIIHKTDAVNSDSTDNNNENTDINNKNMKDNENNNTNDAANDNNDNNDNNDADNKNDDKNDDKKPALAASGEDPIYISSDESMDEQVISEDSDMEDSFDDSDQDNGDIEEGYSNELMMFYLEEIMRYNGKLGDAIESTQNEMMEDMRGLRQFYEYVKRTLRTVRRFPGMNDQQRIQAQKSNHFL